MAKRNHLLIFILTVGVFGILTTEMGVIGLLPSMAEHFDVSVSQAGWLVSAFALAVAVSGPISPLLFSGMDRKKVMLLVLGVFVAGYYRKYSLRQTAYSSCQPICRDISFCIKLQEAKQ